MANFYLKFEKFSIIEWIIIYICITISIFLILYCFTNCLYEKLLIIIFSTSKSRKMESRTVTAIQIEKDNMNLVQPLIAKLDEQVKLTRKSQTDLSSKIQEVSSYLKEITDKLDRPFELDSYARKLEENNARILNVQTTLISIQERIGELQRNIQKEAYQTKEACNLTTNS
ncbi:Snapin/Pallidin/Snn1 family-containing protein [Strongyloides ratti]|uniref:Biogenesis of lysosome-related organelles complex 1 subunit 7 n=1 Tax=Strongyloides ratti TaxID=34506 RepID=A0A090L518_STRRB|nr:Snapin/Pallidin/Snn1 family-containing protein [Strongyloides ratti]CEF62589.1 Snapin/Pallidin/Snn1 family-containing protein [Strongyloides ratti]